MALGVTPSLTGSYGWFYHWLNGKGVRSFSADLVETVLDHAESRFVVDKRARAAVLPPTETYTLVEAAARCGVTQGVMRDILEQGGLINRPKERGRPFRIPEAELRIVQGALHNLIDARGARPAPCMRWRCFLALRRLNVDLAQRQHHLLRARTPSSPHPNFSDPG